MGDITTCMAAEYAAASGLPWFRVLDDGRLVGAEDLDRGLFEMGTLALGDMLRGRLGAVVALHDAIEDRALTLKREASDGRA